MTATLPTGVAYDQHHFESHPRSDHNATLMSLPRFFSPHPLPTPFVADTSFAVGEAVARHIQVLRIAVGEALTLFDGAGGEYAATVHAIAKRDATVTLTAFDAIERESPLNITLVQSLATADKMDFIIQKAVELGVREIVPVAAARSTLKLDAERAEKRTQHWQAVAVAACEQCGRNRVPLVRPVQAFGQWLHQPRSGAAVLLHPTASQNLLGLVDGKQPIALLIGPEGGFTEQEIAEAIQHGVVAARLGPRILRTETAAIAAIAALSARHGDLGGLL